MLPATRSVADSLAVLGAASLAVLASACGVAPLALRRTVRRGWVGLGTAVAAGVMLAVAGGLAVEGSQRSLGLVAVGGLAGLLFVHALRRALARVGDFEAAGLAGADGHRAALIVAVLTLHSAAEAVGLGSSFAGSGAFGLTVAVALAVHKLPEGFAVGVALVPRGVGLRAATGLAAIAAVPLPLLAVPGFLFVHAFRGVLPAALGFAAGAMLAVVVGEMLPEAVRRAPARRVFAYGASALLAAVAFQAAVAVVA